MIKVELQAIYLFHRVDINIMTLVSMCEIVIWNLP